MLLKPAKPAQRHPLVFIARILLLMLLGWLRSLQIGAILVVGIFVVVSLQELGVAEPLRSFQPLFVLEGEYSLGELVGLLQGVLFGVGILAEGMRTLFPGARLVFWKFFPLIVHGLLSLILFVLALSSKVTASVAMIFLVIAVSGVVLWFAFGAAAWLRSATTSQP